VSYRKRRDGLARSGIRTKTGFLVNGPLSSPESSLWRSSSNAPYFRNSRLLRRSPGWGLSSSGTEKLGEEFPSASARPMSSGHPPVFGGSAATNQRIFRNYLSWGVSARKGSIPLTEFVLPPRVALRDGLSQSLRRLASRTGCREADIRNVHGLSGLGPSV
jgi:hypothetical protein